MIDNDPRQIDIEEAIAIAISKPKKHRKERTHSEIVESKRKREINAAKKRATARRDNSDRIRARAIEMGLRTGYIRGLTIDALNDHACIIRINREGNN